MHFGTEDWIDSRKLRKRKYRRFDEEAIDAQILGQIKVSQSLTGHYQCSNTSNRHPRSFGNERHGARRAWVNLEYINPMILNGKLNVHQAAHRQSCRQQPRIVTHSLNMFRINSNWWQDT